MPPTTRSKTTKPAVKTKVAPKKATGAPAPYIPILQFPESQPGDGDVDMHAAALLAPKYGYIIDIEEGTRVNHFEVVVRGSRIVLDEKGRRSDMWCSGCQNGGKLYLCDMETCTRGFCVECIFLTKRQQEIFFKCPACHYHPSDDGEINNKDISPYLDQDGNEYCYTGKLSTRDLWLPCRATAVAIISIRLEGLDGADSPIRGIYHQIQPFLLSNAVFVDLDFNFLTKEGCRSYADKVKYMINLFNGPLKRIESFVVCITNHSTADGLLHTGPRGTGADTVTNVLEAILPLEFQNMLKKSKDSLLFMMSCGSIVTVNESLRELRAFYNKQLFVQMFAFSQANFLVSFASHFLQDFVLNFYVHGKTRLESILRRHQGLGAHSDIFLFRPLWSGSYLCERFIWTHEGIRPVGIPINLQCPDCYSMRPWVVQPKKDPAHERNYVSHSCGWSKCGSRLRSLITFKLPSLGVSWVKYPLGKSDDRGGWVVERVEDAMAEV